MSKVSLVIHPERPEVVTLARELVTHLLDKGHEPLLGADDADLVGHTELAVETSELAQADLALSLGGDGTMLRTVGLVAHGGVPVLGINAGQLGYLTEVEPSGMIDALDRALAGDTTLESRMLIECQVRSASGDLGGHTDLALNDVVVEKISSTIRVAVSIDGNFFTNYATDGLIAATPTGSTAYAFSARGPIIDPGHRALLVTPVSPHMLFDRSLVMGPETRLSLEILGPRPAALWVDGRQLGVLGPGDSIECTAAGVDARFVSFNGRDFHQILKTKFGLEDR
ncbi:MAG: NAD(+)/NADH kinase [Actinomycetia bacterium]|nr:NAD(+)/NADH kinase [Actinomycetes bacterium]MCP3911401.1 NAD(+)/NADH kinase [Actinomycetes bacterium]MCP4084222.1 NAD(+)/NADH kinase [Actinomycetes bacterium]